MTPPDDMTDGAALLAVKTAQFSGLARWTRILNIGTYAVVPTYDDGKIAKTYDHRTVCGDGDTAEEAINDWFGKLPTDRVEAIIWRTSPGLASELNFDTNRTIYHVFSRFAIVPLNAENKDAA
jgi:hypothetical protein